jgi:ComF family protein
MGVYQSSLREAVLQLKFHHNLGLGDEFAPHLKTTLEKTGWSIDLIIPVPLSPKRQSERGYNQAAVIAHPLALSVNIKYEPGALIKTREAYSQIGLSYEQRLANIHNAFIADRHKVKGKNILIVDDVTTTGATLNACGTALLEAGALRVYGLTLAKTSFNPKIPRDFNVEII